MQRHFALPYLALALLILALVWVFLPTAQDAERVQMESSVVQSLPETAATTIEETSHRVPAEFANHLEVQVRVVDRDGNPVGGIPLLAYVFEPAAQVNAGLDDFPLYYTGSSHFYGKRPSTIPSSGTSAEETGLASIWIDPEVLALTQANAQTPSLNVLANIPSRKPVHLTVPWSTRLNGPIELTLPPFRWVDVEVRNLEGELTHEPLGVMMNWEDTDSEGADVWGRNSKILPIDQARGRFACGLGLKFYLETVTKSQLYLEGNLSFTGPSKTSTQIKTQVLTLGPLRPHFRARFLLPDGSPAVEQSVRTYFWRPNQYGKNMPQIYDELSFQEFEMYGFDSDWDVKQTDAEGKGDFVLPKRWAHLDDSFSLKFILQQEDRPSSENRLGGNGSLEVVAGPIPTLNDGKDWLAGDLQFTKLVFPLLAEGTVLSDQGNPIPATVSVYALDSEIGAADSSTERGPVQHKDAFLVNQTPRDDGSFEIYFPTPPSGRIRVVAQAPGYRETNIEGFASSDNFHLRLDHGPVTYGNLILDPSINPESIRVFLHKQSKFVQEDGSFQFKNIPLGKFDFKIRSDRQTLLQVEDVDLQQPDLRYPDELRDLDLRGKIRQWKIRVYDQEGRPFPPKVIFLNYGEDRPETLFLEGTGEFNYLTSTDTEKITVSYGEHEPVELSWPPAATVVLKRIVVKPPPAAGDMEPEEGG
jgi:hypothetical protein